MSVLTQGTQIFFIDETGSAPAVVKVECATTFSPGGSPADQIDDTCLEAKERSYKSGLRKPGTASMGLNADPQIESHVLLHELSEMNPSPTLKWAVGWADGPKDANGDPDPAGEPGLDSNGDFDLPDSRTWFLFEGYVSDFPFDFTQNAVVTTSASIQRSGGSSWIKKVA